MTESAVAAEAIETHRWSSTMVHGTRTINDESDIEQRSATGVRRGGRIELGERFSSASSSNSKRQVRRRD